MKKFRRKFLKESTIDKSEFQGKNNKVHQSVIHGHPVSVDFEKHPHNNEYEVSFRVDGQVSRRNASISPEHGLAIADHVKKVVKSFVHHHKPESLAFIASDHDRDIIKTKHELYVRGLKKLGAISVERHPQYQGNHIAHFKEHFQEYLDTLMEDAHTMSTGPALAGMSAESEPGVAPDNKYKRKNEKEARKSVIMVDMFRRTTPVQESVEIKRGKFAGNDTFIVPSHVYHKAVHHKAKGAHWTKYLNETEYGTAIREFANKNPHKPIVLEDEKTGYLTYARYGNKNKR